MSRLSADATCAKRSPQKRRAGTEVPARAQTQTLRLAAMVVSAVPAVVVPVAVTAMTIARRIDHTRWRRINYRWRANRRRDIHGWMANHHPRPLVHNDAWRRWMANDDMWQWRQRQADAEIHTGPGSRHCTEEDRGDEQQFFHTCKETKSLHASFIPRLLIVFRGY